MQAEVPLHQVRTLFGAGVAGGLSDAELLDRFLSRSAAAEDAALAAIRRKKVELTEKNH